MGKFKLNPNWNKQKVQSSQIKEIAFDQKDKRLYVVFTNNSVYSYSPTTFDDYLEFTSAPSIGKYFHSKIKKLEITKISNG